MEPRKPALDPYLDAKMRIEALDATQRLRLIAEVAAGLRDELGSLPQDRSLLELQGLGKSIWQAIDVDEYLRQERSSWDG